jgi:hypothetical protein
LNIIPTFYSEQYRIISKCFRFPVCHRDCDAQVLGALSQDVLRIVLSAQHLPLSFLLSHLPTLYHPDALRTFFPSAEADHSLEFLGYHWTAETTILAMCALPALTSVTSLKIAVRADLNRRTRSELSSSVLRAVASMSQLKALSLAELCLSNRRAAEDLLEESTGANFTVISVVTTTDSIHSHHSARFCGSTAILLR